jgi:hypothetical protein
MPYPTQPPEPDLPVPERDTTNPIFATRVHVKYMDPWQDQANTRFFHGDSIARAWVPTVIASGDGEYGGLIVGTLSPSTITSKWAPTYDADTTSISPSTVTSWSVSITAVSCTDTGTEYEYTVETSAAGVGKTAVLMPYAEVFPVVGNQAAYIALGDAATVPGSKTVTLTAAKNPNINQYAIVICSGSGASYTVVSLPYIHTP